MHGKNALITILAVSLLAILVSVTAPMRQGASEADAFGQASFAAVGSPLFADAEAEHGQIGVGYIRHINQSFQNRFSFTHVEKDTAVWLVHELLAMGYAWDDIEVQTFTWEQAVAAYPQDAWEMLLNANLLMFIARSPFAHWGNRIPLVSQNVILTVPGQSERTVVVGAHYDTVLFPGASDNDSGVALLLESAMRMRDYDNPYTLRYVFFGAEEVGLAGSYFYTASLTEAQHDAILFMLNADVLFEGPDIFYMAGRQDDDGQANPITDTWDAIARELGARHGIAYIAWPNGVVGPSDHLAFLPYGHTVMFMAGLIRPSDWSPEDAFDDFVFMEMTGFLHSPLDNFDYINQAHPGMMDANMKAYSLLLDALLKAEY